MLSEAPVGSLLSWVPALAWRLCWPSRLPDAASLVVLPSLLILVTPSRRTKAVARGQTS